MTNKCDNCIHNSVCKYKEMYLKTLKDFQKIKYEFPIKFEISCYQFKEDGLSILIPKDNINPCEGCSIYEDIKKGKAVVNDACTFCSKNPIRVGD